jgi:hypothetical protein
MIHTSASLMTLLSVAATCVVPTGAAHADQTRDAAPAGAATAHPFGELNIWDDGLAEMSYYRAVDQIYGRDRSYTRVQLVNRQWMSLTSGVKAAPEGSDSVAVFKLNIAEEIPTENYNYRYLTTVFLTRPALAPFKYVTSSQEWCGTTFKHLRWSDDGLLIKSFSYFEGEGDRTSQLDESPVPYEALILVARDVAAAGTPREVALLKSMRSNRQVEPKILQATLVPRDVTEIKVADDMYQARRVDLEWEGPPTGFVVEAEPPFRLLRYRMDSTRGELLFVERRAYWDRSSSSGFHEPNQAP